MATLLIGFLRDIWLRSDCLSRTLPPPAPATPNGPVHRTHRTFCSPRFEIENCSRRQRDKAWSDRANLKSGSLSATQSTAPNGGESVPPPLGGIGSRWGHTRRLH